MRCAIGVGFDVYRGTVERFLVQLTARENPEAFRARQIARIDHNPSSPRGHDLGSEDIHIDVRLVDGTERTLHPRRGKPTATDLGRMIERSIEYFDTHAAYFLGVSEGRADPSDVPDWP